MTTLDFLTNEDRVELGEASVRVETAVLMATPAEWPLDRYLPVVKWKDDGMVLEGEGATLAGIEWPVDAGMLLRQKDGTVEPTVRVPDGEPIRYDSFDAMVADGWRAD